jgi:hypothetical protein
MGRVKMVLIPYVDRICVCRNPKCKKEFIIPKEKLRENYLGCTHCGCLRWDDKKAVDDVMIEE